MLERVRRTPVDRESVSEVSTDDVARQPAVRRRTAAGEWRGDLPLDGATLPTTVEMTRIRRSASADVIRRSPGDVTIEEVADEPTPSKEPVPVVQPATPLLLTDRPWAEIEEERAARYRPTIEDVPDEPAPSREPVPVSKPSSPLLLTDRPWADIERERAQQQDPRWQQRVKQVNRPIGDTQPGRGAAIAAHTKRRRGRQLGPSVGAQLQDQRQRQVAETQRTSTYAELGTSTAAVDVGAAATTLGAAQTADASAKAQRAIEDAVFDVEPGKGALQVKRNTVATRLSNAKSKAKPYGIETTLLGRMERDATGLANAKKWAALDSFLDEVGSEAQKILSYVTSLDTIQERLTKLGKTTPQKEKVRIRQTYFEPFRQAVTAPKRNDAVALATLTALENAIVAEEAKDAALMLKTTQRANGLWPGNNNAAAVITEVTRATVGTAGQERQSIVEALDALKDGSKDHSWARKWGEYHGNGEGNLPGIPGGGGYKEYYVRPAGSVVGAAGQTVAGTRRLVKSNDKGFVYYSPNHYGQPNGTTLPAFYKITDP